MSRKLFAIAAAAAVAGCGGSESSGGSSGGDAPPFGSEEFGLTNEVLNARIEDAEALIATCMTSSGFEYVPVDAVTIRDAMSADGSLPNVSDEDFIAQYGFGITTIFDDPVLQQGRGEQNTAIRDRLSPADQVAYDRALVGEGGVSLARALEDEDFSETGGCTVEAAEQLFATEELSGTYVNPGDVLIEQDPRMVAAIADWSTCVSDAGYDYQHPDDITDDLAERLGAILTGADADALVELQGEERAVATVSETCEDEHIVPAEEVIETEIYGGVQG